MPFTVSVVGNGFYCTQRNIYIDCDKIFCHFSNDKKCTRHWCSDSVVLWTNTRYSLIFQLICCFYLQNTILMTETLHSCLNPVGVPHKFQLHFRRHCFYLLDYVTSTENFSDRRSEKIKIDIVKCIIMYQHFLMGISNCDDICK